MKRLNDNELDARINSFLTRKFEELELDGSTEHNHIAHGVTGVRENKGLFKGIARYGLRWHQAHTA